MVGESASWSMKFWVAVGLCWLSLWLPATAADWWLDQVHEPRFGSTPLPPSQLLVGSSVMGVGLLTVLALCAAAVVWLGATGDWWSMWFVGLGCALVGLLGLARHRAELSAMNLAEVSDMDQAALAAIAQETKVSQVSFWSVSSVVEPGCNALTVAGFRRGTYRIVLSEELLEAVGPTRRFVVVHELGHVRARHLRQQAFVSGVEVAVGLGVPAAILWAMPAWIGLVGEGIRDPRNLPVLLSLVMATSAVLSLPSAWFSRSNERQADAVAVADAVRSGIDPVALVRELYLSERSNLSPSLVERLIARHPTAAERLQLAKLATF